MPPKKGNPPAFNPAQLQEGAEEEPLQAVVLADSFNKRFQVLCVDKPRCLLPLLGVPLLAWTLESLSLSNVKDVIVFCGVHADDIKQWVTSSSYAKTLNIQCISSTSAQSIGDALRQLDAMQILNPKLPFLLLHSPVVSNTDLSRLVRDHRKLREEDKNVIMTLGVGTGGRRHPESPIFLVDPEKGHLLHYTPNPLLPVKSRWHIPSALILDNPQSNNLTLEVWSGPSAKNPSSGGYRDLGVDVCEADVPALFTENFDWNDLRRHLVTGVLGSELLGKKIGVKCVGAVTDEEEDEDWVKASGVGRGMGLGRYIDRVRDTRTLGDISRDVLRRWAFPLVPDSKILGQDDYELRRGTVYVARQGVRLARTTQIIGPALIGPNTHLSSNTTFRTSTIGRSSHIASHTTIIDSYIFDNVSIGKGCVLKGCIVAQDVVIGDNVRIGVGALVGAGVRVGDGEVIEDFARVARTPFGKEEGGEEGESEDDEYAPDVPPSTRLERPGSEGYVWPTEDEAMGSDDEDDLDDPYEHPDNKRLLQLGQSLSRIPSASSEASTLEAASSEGSPLSIASSTGGQSIPSMSLNPTASTDFHVEVRLSLERAVDEDHKAQDALLELTTLMLSSNVSVSGRGGGKEEVIGFFMGLIDVTLGAKVAKDTATKVWTRWGPLVNGIGVKPKDTILEVQHYCTEHPEQAPFFPIYLNALYDADMAEYEDIVLWYKSEESRGKGENETGAENPEAWRTLWASGGRFVKALAEAQEDSDEEDDDDEEDSN